MAIQATRLSSLFGVGISHNGQLASLNPNPWAGDLATMANLPKAPKMGYNGQGAEGIQLRPSPSSAGWVGRPTLDGRVGEHRKFRKFLPDDIIDREEKN